MCECLEYVDGAMHLCSVCADIYREKHNLTACRCASIARRAVLWDKDADDYERGCRNTANRIAAAIEKEFGCE